MLIFLTISHDEKFEAWQISKKTIKDVSNHFRLKKIKKETNNAAIKSTSKTIKYKIIRGIRNLFEHEEEDYCKPIRVNNFWNNNYIECKSKRDRKTLSA